MAPFLTRLRSRAWLAGTVVSSPDLVLAERIGQAFDLVWIDLEHSALSARDAQQLAIAVRAGGAAALVKAIHYPPSGTRGFAPRRASGGLANSNGDSGLAGVACLVQIESSQGLENVESIAATDGVDALVVGTADLSFNLGAPLLMDTPALTAGVSRVGAAANAHGVAWGVAVGVIPTWLEDLHTLDASLFVFSSDSRLYSEAIAASIARVREIAPTRSPKAQASLPSTGSARRPEPVSNR